MPLSRSRRLKTWRSTAVSRPRATLAHLRGRHSAAQDAMVLAAANHLFRSATHVACWTAALAEIDRAELIPPRASAPVGNSEQTTLGRWLYALTRVTKPEVVVETGVAHGSSSWIILNALERNGSGTLHSIDLPDHDTAAGYNVSGERTGSVVPDALRPRWNLVLGESAEELPQLLTRLRQIDMFFHDSDHSYEAMKGEFDAVIPRLRNGGILIADDVQKNRAFTQACELHGLRHYVFRKGGTAARSG